MQKRFVLGFMIVAFFGITMSQPESARAASFKEEMIAKAKKEGALVLAGSVVEDIKQGVLNFRKQYPFIKIKSLEMNTKSTVNRVSLEAKAGRLSIDWAGISEDGAEIFVRRGLNAKYTFPHLKDFVPGTQPPHGMYVSGFANPRVQGAYNTDLIKPEDVPKSWEEMGDPKWKGKTMISSSSEEIPGRLAWMWRDKNGKWDWDRAFDLFRKLKAHSPVVARGYSGGNTRVAAGEVAIFWFTPATPGAMLAVIKGAPMGLIAFPKFFGGLRAWSIFKDSPHPASAWLLTDYMTSPEGQYELTERGGEAGGFLTLNKKAKTGKILRWVKKQGAVVENTIFVDLNNLKEIYSKENQEKSEQFFFKLLGLR